MTVSVTEVKVAVADLRDYCIFARENDTISMSEWVNGEGYTIELVTDREDSRVVQLTIGELEALVELFEELDK